MSSNKYIDFVDMWNLIEATSTEFFYERLEAIGLHRGQPKMLRFLGENDGCRQKDIADRFFPSGSICVRCIKYIGKTGTYRAETESEIPPGDANLSDRSGKRKTGAGAEIL